MVSTRMPEPLFPGHPKGGKEIITDPPEDVTVERDGEATSANITEEKIETSATSCLTFPFNVLIRQGQTNSYTCFFM